MKRKFTFLIAAAFMLLTMMASTGTMWGQTTYNLTIETSDFNTTSYAANNGAHTKNAIDVSNSNNTLEIGWYSNQVYQNSNVMQWQKNNGYIYNTTDLGTINSVTVNSTAGTFTTYYGTEAHPTSGTTVGNGFFTTQVGNATGKTTSIVINFTIGGGTAPSITAANVNMAYDATADTIFYTVNNPVTGGEMSSMPITGGDWLNVSGPNNGIVLLSCSANPATTARTATVQLTYTYNAKETVTKDVTVTQAAAPVIYTTIPELFAAATSAGSTATSVDITLNNWVVSGVSTNGKNVFVTDNNGNGFVIFDNGGNMGFTAGNILSGTVSCKVQLYNGFAEITQLNSQTTGISINTGGTVTAADIEMADLAGVNTGALLHYDNLTCSVSNNKYYLSDGTTTLQVYNAIYAFGTTLVADHVYNITGVYQQFNTTKEILPRSADDIEIVETEVADPVFSPTAGTYATTQTVTMSCTTEGAAIHYTTDGTDPDGNSTQYTEPISVSTTTTFKAKAIKGNDASNLVTTTYHINSATAPYTVAQALAFNEYPTSTIWVHGIVSTAPTDAPNNGQLTYYISDNGEATNQLQVYKGKGLNNAAFTAQDDIQVGDIVTITGIVKIYNTTTEFDAGNYLTSFERPTPPTVPTITVNPTLVDATAAETEGTLTVTYTAIETDLGVEIHWFETSTSTEPLSAAPGWIDADFSTTSIETIDYVIEANTDEARTAYFKVYGLDGEANAVYSELVTINQAAGTTPPTPGQYDWVATTLANLTSDDVFVIVGDNGDTYAMSNDNGSSAPTAEAVTIENGSITGTVADNIQWNLSTSDDGYMFYPNGTTETWLYCTNTNNGVKVGTGDAKHFTLSDNGYITTSETTDQRYIGIYNSQDWRCYTSEGGNIANQTFAFYKRVPASTEPSITLNQYTYNLNADGGDAVLPVTTANLATSPQLAVVFYESDGTTTTTYDWISATINNAGNIAGHIDENEGAARTAYFKVSGLANDNTTTVYSDLVTINQAAYVLSITFETTELNIEVGGESDRKISFDYSGLGSDPTFEVRRYESDGTTPATYDWLTTSINKNKVNISVAANTGAARHAYFRVYGAGSVANTESNLVTINQAAYVAPTYTVTYNANGGTGTMTDPNSPYAENTQVTLLENTFGAPEGKLWDSWLVKDANQTTIDVNNNTFTMPASNVTVTAQWVDNPVVPTYEWVLTALEDLTANDVFVIVGNNGSNYAMTNGNGTTSAPSASAVTIANDKLSNAPADNLKWNISGNATDGYTFYPNGVTDKWLYCTDANNGLRVGTNANKVFAYEEVTTTNKEGNYLTISPGTDKRYVCIYNNADWRSYKSGSIVKTDTKFYKRQVASTDPSLYTNNVNIASDATADTIIYTLENPVPGGILTAEITASNAGNWLTLGTVGENIPFTCSANTQTTERTATVTLTYTYNTKASITATAIVTQAGIVIDYATMPFAFDGGRNDIENVNGLTQEGLDTDYGSSPKLKFNTTGDWVILKLNAKPVSIIYDIKGNGFSGGTFSVQISEDGVVYDDLKEYTSLSDVQTELINNDNNAIRYIKWIYTTKDQGNVALGNIKVYDVAVTIINNNTTINDLTIPDNEAYVVGDGVVLELTGTVTNANPENLIIEDGGQLIHENPVQATIQRSVNGYGAKSVSGWYTIASPVDGVSVSIVTTGDYDLFKYIESSGTWYNQKAHTGDFLTLSRGVGYLYANSDEKIISYLGEMIGTETEVSTTLSYACSNPTFKGANLLGNPFSRNLVAGNIKLSDTAITVYYGVEGGGEMSAKLLADTPIKPGQGFFLQAKAAGQNLVFNPSAKGRGVEKVGFISIAAGNNEFTDNAFVQFGGGNILNKMTISDNSSIVYVRHNNQDYAAARINALEGSMPVCFKANKLGSYTITIEAKDIKAEYLHLIDNFTHEDIDLLLEPSYTFVASDGDNASRFTLVFRIAGYEGYTTDNDFFAYQNGNDIIVNGNGELQVFDVMGRTVMNTVVSYGESVKMPANGVYIFRLIGDTLRTQKIVVR